LEIKITFEVFVHVRSSS